MRGTLVVLASALIGLHGAAWAAPPRVVGLESEAAEQWVDVRIRHAQQGERELVRIPVVHRSLGWGCVCPDQYIGESSDTGALRWLDVSAGPHADLPKPGRLGYVVVAEGYFTGDKDRFVWDDPEPPEVYDLWGFHVLRSRGVREDETLKLAVVLDGAEAKRKIAPLADGRRWLTIAASVPLASPGGAERVEKVRRRLVAAGFAAAEVIDSRQAPRLFCCHRVVLVGRHATRDKARAAAKAVNKRRRLKVKAYARQGW